MKVYELISQLEKLPAGNEVLLRRGFDTWTVGADSLETSESDEYCVLIGDGSESDDGSIPN